MNCTICGKRIVLVPSARQRTKKFGNSPAYYTSLFREHAECALAKSKADTNELMRKKKDLTGYAIDGYEKKRNDNPRSSPAWYACEIGKMFKRSGRAIPSSVRMGRGYQVHASGLLFHFGADGRISIIK